MGSKRLKKPNVNPEDAKVREMEKKMKNAPIDNTTFNAIKEGLKILKKQGLIK